MDNLDVIELTPMTVRDLVDFCVKNNTNADIVLDMGGDDRPFISVKMIKHLSLN